MSLPIKLIQEPYRIFFPLGVLMGMIGVGHWLFFGLGLIDQYLGFQHASIQIQLFMFCFITGFLLTAMPKILLADPCSPFEALFFLVLVVGMITFEFLTLWVGVQICFLIGIASLHLFILKRGRCRKAPLPAEFSLLFLGFFHAVSGTFLLMLYQMGWFPGWGMGLGRQLFQLGFLLCIVMSIGGFMLPRFLGYYSAENVSLELDSAKRERKRKKELAFHLCVGIILFLSFWLEPLGLSRFSFFLRAFFVTAQILRTTKIYRSLPEKTPFNLLVWASLWSIIVGLWGIFIFPQYHVAMKHFIFIGGVSLMTFTVATKVIYSHAGLEGAFHKRMLFMGILGGFVFVALIFRVLADLLPEFYFLMLSLAASFWLIGVVIWLVVVFPKLLFSPQGPIGCPRGCTRR